MTDGIVNKVAGSGLVTVDLETFYLQGERVVFDIAPHLYDGQILKEKDFRNFAKEHDWSAYSGKIVSLVCSADAIIPAWAWMLLAIALQPHATRVFHASPEEVEDLLLAEALSAMDVEPYRDARVVVKGCSGKKIPQGAYVILTSKLVPVVKSLMFGEPCSTVPLYKRRT